MRILCFGSLNIDHTYRLSHFPLPGETMSADSYQTYCGGKGLNQSVALVKTGAEVFHAGQIGENGTMLTDFLRECGVDTRFVRTDATPTGHAIIQVEAGGQNCIILYEGANKTLTEEFVDSVLAEFSEGDALVLQNEINQMPYIMRSAKARGMKIFFNPAPFTPEVYTYPLKTVDFLVVNETEAMGLTETDSPEAAIEALTKKSPCETVIVTLGSAGSCAVVGGCVHYCGRYKVKAVDTTAAGDTYMGYLVSEIMRGTAPQAAMKTSAKAAAIAVSRYGAGASVPSAAEVAAAELDYNPHPLEA